ncbi:probable cytochrome P450 9f2 [Phlebotomus argentipes]|uniref:probable cytochrome P450 9f2 n=1 Tax=Phlebotomus argentipes TaxID=94469 RepID=UPI00289367CD|nr:probable cytochrome P450 9f2 [Phlebotomus argentipes]
MFELLLLVAVAFLVKFIIDKGYKNENFFKDRGIKSLKPAFLFGNSGNLFLRRKTMIDFFKDSYFAFPNERLIGMYEFRTPNIMVRDPELVKQLAVKEFEHFPDHRSVISNDAEPIFGKSLISLKGDEWRDMRATLSPAFTGSKMRLMFELVSQCAKQMSAFIDKETKAKGVQTYDMKDFFSRMTNDIIATCAFGFQVNSLENQKNEFFMKGKEMMDFTNIFRLIKFMVFMAFPKVFEKLGIKLIPDSLTGFFKSAITDTMDYREKNHIIRPDMINLLMEAKKGNLTHQTTEHQDSAKDSAGFATVEESEVGKAGGKKVLTQDDILAQCFLFFLAGFETVSQALSFLAYELAVNQDVQEKLYEEIREINEELGSKSLNYDTLQKMKYMDMVVSELLRLWPPAIATDRLCTKDVLVEVSEDVKYQFKKGDFFMIPVIGFHHDPKYFSNPEKFDPERFSDENKHNITPGTYIPFGVGPRNCIGSRFALMEVKALLYYLILDFIIEPNEKTQIPLKLSKDPALKTEKGIWVQFTPRNKA